MQEKIKHVTWGDGIITEMQGKYIHVLFNDPEIGCRTFIYPDAFEKHMKYYDLQLQSDAEQIIRERRENDEAARRLEQQKRQQSALAARAKLLELKSKQRKTAALRRKKTEVKKQEE